MSVSAPPGRTHLYYSGTPDFAFGSGLSYSKWELEARPPPRAAEDVAKDAPFELAAAGGSLHFEVHVTNKGPFAGGQRVLAFARPSALAAMPPRTPRQRLWAFKAVDKLEVGASTFVRFTLLAADLATSNAQGERVVIPGQEYVLAFSDGTQEVRASIQITGNEPVVVEKSALRK